MLTRITLVCVLALLVRGLLSVAAAQPYGSDLIVSCYDGSLQRVSPSGPISPIGRFGPGNLWSIVWDIDNRHLLAAVSTTSTPPAGYMLRIDPATGQAATLVPATGFASLVELDRNGDYLLSCQTGFNTRSIERISRSSLTRTTLQTGFPILPTFTQDWTSGDWILASQNNLLERYSADWSQIKTTIAHTLGYTYRMAQDPWFHDMYVAGFGFGKYDPGTNKVTTISMILPSTLGDRGLAIDRAPDRYGSLIYVSGSGLSASSIYKYDRGGTNLSNYGPIYSKVTGLVFDRSLNLCSELVAAANDRVLHLSFPGDEGRGYIVALGLTGYTPGLPLADGRMIPISPDNLTFLTAVQQVPPYVIGNHGVLSVKGEAVVKLNFNALGSAISGLRMWAVAVTFDSRAPLGISQISRPLVLVL